MLVFNKYLKELGYKKSDFTDSKDPRYNKPPQTPGLVHELEGLGFRPHGYEW